MGVSERFRIGRLARETGRSVHAIRWYERQGLMPGVERDSGGRRVYSNEHVSWLRFLERLKCAGMSMREMKAYAALVRRGRASIGERMELLAAQQRRTAALIAELQEAQRLIARKQAYYRKWRAAEKWPGPFEVDEERPRGKRR